MLLMAQAQFYLGKFNEAIETAVALVAAHPGSRCVPVAQFTHAEALCELLQFDAALLLFDDVVKTARDDDLRLHMKMLEGNFAAYNIVDQMPDELPEARYPRRPGRRPCSSRVRPVPSPAR